MRKKLNEEIITKSRKRELKKRPKMKIHGVSLKRNNPHAGRKLTTKN